MRARTAAPTNPLVSGDTTDALRKLAESGRRFGTIYADPPWAYNNRASRGAACKHYPVMSVDEIAALGDVVRQLAADDSHLHLWTTNAFLFDAMDVIDAWGFEFQDSFVWVKPQMGLGNYLRVSHEFLLLGVRGNARSFADKNLPSWAKFDRLKHSQKPEAVRQMIERASPGPYLEMFARRTAPGWTVWGNQVEQSLFDEQPVPAR